MPHLKESDSSPKKVFKKELISTNFPHTVHREYSLLHISSSFPYYLKKSSACSYLFNFCLKFSL